MPRSWPFKKLVAVASSIALLGFGVTFLIEGHQGNQAFEQWRVARPMEGPIDLSSPGRFVFPFEQTCSISHGETVSLHIAPEIWQSRAAADLLAGLQASLEISEVSGGKVVETENSEFLWAPANPDQPVPLFRLPPFRKGAYTATVTVLKGASGLKGAPQRIEGSYVLCGLERFPAQLANAVGIAALAGGLTLFLLALRIKRVPKKP